MSKEVTVIYSADDDPDAKPREKMTLRDAYSKIDDSKQYSYCTRCGHDIRQHASTLEYKTKYAGRCEVMFDEGIPCACPQYYYSGVTRTQKEIDLELSRSGS
jgi:hypothetical protein